MENLDVPHRLKRGKTPPKVSRKRSELATKVITIVTTILTSKGWSFLVIRKQVFRKSQVVCSV